jgi:hypothetical protein
MLFDGLLFVPMDTDSTFIRKLCEPLLDYTVSHPKDNINRRHHRVNFKYREIDYLKKNMEYSFRIWSLEGFIH